MRKMALCLVLMPLMVLAQVRIPKEANRFTYWQLDYGEQTDTSIIVLERQGERVNIIRPRPEGDLIAGYAQAETVVDYAEDSITTIVRYADSTYYYRSPLSRSDIEWQHEGERYTCSINSNRLEFEMDEHTPLNATPMPYYGLRRGVLRSFVRNGQKQVVLAKAERVKGVATVSEMPAGARRVSPRELDAIMKQRLVVSTRIFDNTRLHWGAKNAHVEGNIEAVPFDTVLHYAGGTLAIKRVKLPELPHHYQHFVEIRQHSDGDAYDRTGSLFEVTPGFFEGINNRPDTMPIFVGRDGQRYQGIVATEGFQPAVEWVRFFTPFGIGRYNDRMQIDGLEWRKETYYRQEITDLYHGGEVVLGVWIGNYDGGGHLLTVDIKSYPNDYSSDMADVGHSAHCESLFNTCNVLEMAGQNYGKLFATDSLRVSFVIPAEADGARLRYLSTGHGGWGEGDEFVPKANSILIDDHEVFCYTPWRQDCGTYRDLNPVSGNFWNGLSSSDFSRSGWCPGTATQPIYFDLMPWADGKRHTMTVAIPQGKPIEGMFSHWAVSGTLIVEQ